MLFVRNNCLTLNGFISSAHIWMISRSRSLSWPSLHITHPLITPGQLCLSQRGFGQKLNLCSKYYTTMRFCWDICRVNLSHTTHFTSIFHPNNKTFLWIDKVGYAWNFLTTESLSINCCGWILILECFKNCMFMVSRLNQREVNHPCLTQNMLLKLHTDCLFYDKKVFDTAWASSRVAFFNR